MVAPNLVGRRVTNLAKGVENVRCLLWDDTFERKSAKPVLKCLAFPLIKRVAGSDRLGQKLGKLAQLEDRRAGIIAEITLRKRPKLDELGVMYGQKREIARRRHRSSPPLMASYLSDWDAILQPPRVIAF